MKLSIEKIVYGGAGLAHSKNGPSAGEAVFVPFTLPGELVEAGSMDTSDGYRDAALEQVITPSSDRVAPRCVHFGVCGGCQYQHASYEAQLHFKQDILQESLERAGLNSLPAIQVHAGQPWEYRNRIRLRVARVDGELRVGYLRRGSKEFLPVHMCPIAAPLLWRAAESFLQIALSFRQWADSTEEIEFFTTGDEQKMQLQLFVRAQPAKGLQVLCEALQMQVPELTGAGVQIMTSSGGGRKSLRLQAGANWGAQGMSYAVADEIYWVSRGGFFQVNRFLVTQLVELAAGDRSGNLAWDLYAGVGLFSRVLAKRFMDVVAVEASAGDLAINFRGTGRRAITATTVEFLQQAVIERDRPELIVMDPPRGGVGTEVCALLARIKASEIVYVSCDPATLGRDLKAMVDSGYKLNQLHLVDMFPQTFHQETVAVLGR